MGQYSVTFAVMQLTKNSSLKGRKEKTDQLPSGGSSVPQTKMELGMTAGGGGGACRRSQKRITTGGETWTRNYRKALGAVGPTACRELSNARLLLTGRSASYMADGTGGVDHSGEE